METSKRPDIIIICLSSLYLNIKIINYRLVNYPFASSKYLPLDSFLMLDYGKKGLNICWRKMALKRKYEIVPLWLIGLLTDSPFSGSLQRWWTFHSLDEQIWVLNPCLPIFRMRVRLFHCSNPNRKKVLWLNKKDPLDQVLPPLWCACD